MESPRSPHPPKWASRLLTWYCRPELLEDLEGDLNEYFERNVKTKGLRRARIIYVVDVIKFFRPYTVRKLKFFDLLIQWIMLGSYIKTSTRSIARNKLFSTINIAGLAFSMSVGLLLIGLLSDLLSYDQFHENKGRIYRVISNYQYMQESNNDYFASTSLKAGEVLRESLPGIEDAAVLYSGADGDIKTTDNKVIPIDGFWANASFFHVFTFPLIEGDAATALSKPFSIVLTEESAQKLYGTSDIIGKTISLNAKDDQPYTITGVMENIPKFSHLQFEMLISLKTREITEKERAAQEMAWDNIWQGYVYLLLPEKTTPESLQSSMDALCLRENKTVKNSSIKLKLQPLSEIIRSKLNNSISDTINNSVIVVVMALAGIVILSACFNYTNLSIARSLKRAREVGVRKVVGATRRFVIGQFLTESVLISLMALVVACGLFMVLKPFFLSVNASMQRLLELNITLPMIGYFVLLAVAIGLLAGFLPALFFSRLQAVQVLKGNLTGSFKNINLRKALIIFQFTISLGFIAATLIAYREYAHFTNFNLGFKTDNIINIRLQGTAPDQLIKELQEFPETEAISKSQMITGLGNYYGSRLKYKNPQDSLQINFNAVDENYISLHEHQLVAGRNFNPVTYEENEHEVIITENLLPFLSIDPKTPGKALGETVKLNGKDMQIVGVLKDYYYGSATDEHRKVVFRYIGKKPSYLNVKMSSTDWVATMQKIEQAWKKVDQVHPVHAEFYSEQIKGVFHELLSLLKIIGFLASLAICIAALGLLGMVVFTTETRLKEISIRKVMGASTSHLIYLLSKNFLLLLFVSACIALPATYYLFDRFVLTTLKNHLPINLLDLVAGIFIVMSIALMMIGSQTLKAARSNPARILKSE